MPHAAEIPARTPDGRWRRRLYWPCANTPRGRLTFIFIAVLVAGLTVVYSWYAEKQWNKVVYLRHGGSWFFHHDRVALSIRKYGYDLDIRHISVPRLSVTDSSGKQCPWRTASGRYSMTGPGFSIIIDSREAKGTLVAAGELRYRGVTYDVNAKWYEEQHPFIADGVRWSLVYCTITPQAGAPKSEARAADQRK
jgi:hypothetical protein